VLDRPRHDVTQRSATAEPIFKDTESARLYIADDHPLMLEAFSSLFLCRDPTIAVVGFGNISALERALMGNVAPDLVLLDLGMVGLSGVGGVGDFLGRHPGLRVGIIAGTVDSRLVQDLMRIGCFGVIPKTLPPNVVFHAIRLMMGGSHYLPECLGDDPARDSLESARPRSEPMGLAGSRSSGLTRREVEVLRSLAMGQTNKQIARALEIKEATVKLHLRHGYTKLDVRNRIGAARAVLEGALD
jgi:DNA-binding NarL/FixJ family response regulator